MPKIVASVVIIMAALVVFSCTRDVDAQQAGAGRQWQYAELSTTMVGPNNSVVRWEDATRVLEAEDYAELLKKMGAGATRGDSTTVLNVAGAEGWEVVAHTQTGRANGQLVWTLKRLR